MKSKIYIIKEKTINHLSKIKNIIFNYRLRKRNWKDIEYFDTSWKKRIERMSYLVDANQSVADIGCGQMWLKDFLKKDTQYIGIDYIKRSADTIVCDFNNDEFPNVTSDVFFLSGVLEYVIKPDLFLQNICKKCETIIMSYCTRDLSPDRNFRKNMGWVNNLSKMEIVKIVECNNFILIKTDEIGANVIFKFIKKI